MKRAATFLAILFLLGIGVLAQEADDPLKTPFAEIYLAKDDGTGMPGEPATAFVVTDIPIHLVVQLSTGRPATVKMNLVAADVPGVRPDTRVVSTTYTTKDLQNRVNFTGSPDGKWVAGEYRADIYIDDKLISSITFPITHKESKPQVPRVIGSSTKRSQRARSN